MPHRRRRSNFYVEKMPRRWVFYRYAIPLGLLRLAAWTSDSGTVPHSITHLLIFTCMSCRRWWATTIAIISSVSRGLPGAWCAKVLGKALIVCSGPTPNWNRSGRRPSFRHSPPTIPPPRVSPPRMACPRVPFRLQLHRLKEARSFPSCSTRFALYCYVLLY